MKYSKTVILRNGKECLLRNGTLEDGKTVFDIFTKTHLETDYLLSYPEENNFGEKEEGEYLDKTANSNNAIEVMAIVDGKCVGLAGINPIGTKYKVRHRADFGISVLKDYWGMGIGSVLMEACVSCAREAEYKQIELEVVADNERAISLYKKYGFIEFGRNPKGFNSKLSGYQEVVLMRLDI